MDELWQRYRTFWTPVLIGIGVFLVGLIAVHIITKNPEDEAKKLQKEQSRLSKLQRPAPGMIDRLRDQTAAFEGNVKSWSERLDTSASGGKRLLEAAVDRTLRAAILRGAPDSEAKRPETLAHRFDDDVVAAGQAIRKFKALRDQHVELLKSGDPNVAFSSLNSEAWQEMRIRANRADMEIASGLGFESVASVSRATLPGRALTQAVVTEAMDLAIRYGMHAVDQVRPDPNLKPRQGNAFYTEWPVSMSMVGPYGAVLKLIDHVTQRDHPLPLLAASIEQPGRKADKLPDGIVECNLTIAASVVRADASLGLERETE